MQKKSSMEMTISQKNISILLVVCLVVLCASKPHSSDKNLVMPWMCLERCNDTEADIEAQLQQISDHVDSLSAVSFELYNLGPNSTLIINSDLYNVGPIIQSDGLETYPMISSYPYPPDFLAWMRQLFANPQPFFDACIEQLEITGYTGMNVDFEPTAQATETDAINYANWLTEFANALHAVGKKVSVDIGSWSTIWNWELIGESTVDYVLVMSTYTTNYTVFASSLDKAVSEIPLEKLGIGLEDDAKTYSDADLQSRFDLIDQKGIQQIDIWRTGIPENWWSFINKFADGTRRQNYHILN